MNTKMVSANEATENGFAKFNDGPHLCVEIPDGHSTITVKTSSGKLITFAFLPEVHNGTPVCVDIHHATAEKKTIVKDGVTYETHSQNVNLFGQGFYKDPFIGKDYYRYNSFQPVTLTSINLGEIKII